MYPVQCRNAGNSKQYSFVASFIFLGSPLLLALSGCDETNNSPAALAAPGVSSVTPLDSATDVSLTAIPGATFNTDIFGLSVDNTSFTLAGTGAVSGNVALDGTTNIATLAPGDGLSILTRYTATLTTAITDLAGTALPADYNWSFTTREGVWGPPVLAESVPGSISDMQIASDGNGNAMAVWVRDDGTALSIGANRYVAGSGWEVEVLLEFDSAQALNPQVAMDASGNAIVVWRQTFNGTYDIFARRYAAGSGWEKIELLESGAGGAREPQVVMGPNGDAIVLWTQTSGLISDIHIDYYVPGTGWGTESIFDTGSGDASGPQIVMDSNGNAVVVWNQYDTVGLGVYTNRYVAGSGWGTEEVIKVEAGVEAYYPQIAINNNGDAVAAWRQTNGAGLSVYASQYTSATGWSAETLIDTVVDSESPKVAIDSSGNAVAVWAQDDGSVFNVYANYFSVDSGWGTSVPLETSARDAEFPQVVMDLSGNVIAVWQQDDSVIYDRLAYNRYVAGTGWSGAAVVETLGTSIHARNPRIVMDRYGKAMALSYNVSGSVQSAVSNRFE